jgi:hypothetical protein
MIPLQIEVNLHVSGQGGNGPWAIDSGGTLGCLLEGSRNLLSLSCWSAKRLSALTSPMPGTRVMPLQSEPTECVSYAPGTHRDNSPGRLLPRSPCCAVVFVERPGFSLVCLAVWVLCRLESVADSADFGFFLLFGSRRRTMTSHLTPLTFLV